jgi:CheY-like chemotaxis protein
VEQPRSKILVVDDDQEVRESTVQLLAESGYEVKAASSGPGGLAVIHSGYRPDVIIADYRMIGMNGAEFLLTVRSDPELENIPTILVSDFAQLAVAEMAGAAGYLKKPYYPDQMLDLVAELATSGSSPSSAGQAVGAVTSEAVTKDCTVTIED